MKISSSYQGESLDCAYWDRVNIGDTLDCVDAWTVFNSLDEVPGHAVIDSILAALEVAMIIFLLNIRTFIEWVERQTKQSEIVFTRNSQRKEKI